MSQETYEGIVVAQRLRQELGLADAAPVSCVVEVAERRLALSVVLASLPGGTSGFYVPSQPTSLVFVREDHNVQRQRFTVAHEIGHHALGHASAPRIHGAPEPAGGLGGARPPGDLGTARPPGVPDPAHYRPQRAANADERAANAFAGELLAPDAGARIVLEQSAGEPLLDRVVRLSSHFGVSAFAAVVKLQMLGEIDREGAAALRDRLGAGEHLPRYEALGLAPHVDELQRHADAGGGPRCSPAARRALAALRRDVDAG